MTSTEIQRITSICEVAHTTATTIDSHYNNRSDKVHIVSSDGVLFCINEKYIELSEYLAYVAQVTQDKEIIFFNKDFERASVVRVLLDILTGRRLPEQMKPHLIDRTLRLADKYNFEVAIPLLLHYLEEQLDRGANPFQVFLIAARFDDVALAKKAVPKLLGTAWQTHGLSSPEEVQRTPGTYLMALCITAAAAHAQQAAPVLPSSGDNFETTLYEIKKLKGITVPPEGAKAVRGI